MKTFSFLFFVCLFSCHITFAQFRMSAGVKGGGALSTFEDRTKYGNKNDYYHRVPGWYGGVTFNASLRKWFFQPELLYSLRGFRTNYTNWDGYGVIYSSGKIYERYGYISLPLLIGFKPVKKLSIMIGPELGYMISAKERYDKGSKKNVLKYVPHRHTVDLDAGLAWDITSKLTVEGRFVYGVKPLFDMNFNRPGTFIKLDEDGYNKVIQLGVTYKLFNLK